MHFWQEQHRNDVVSFSVPHYQEAYYVCLGPVTLTLIISLRWGLPGVSTLMLLFCSTELISSTWGDIPDYIITCFFSNFHSPIYIRLMLSCLWQLQNSDFSTPSYSIFISCHSTVRKSSFSFLSFFPFFLSFRFFSFLLLTHEFLFY